MTENKLILGDCFAELKKVEDRSIDMVVTDPPYGMNFLSNRARKDIINVKRKKHKAIENDDAVMDGWLDDAFRVLKDGGGLISFCDWNTSHLWREAIESRGFEIKSQVVWNRMHHGMGDLTGAFSPMHDIIWYATKGRRVFANTRPKSVLSHKRPSPTEDNGHPTCKPVELMKELIIGIGDGSNGVILDPFMGSGSTGVAATLLGIPFIGMELEEEYFNIAKRRIEDANPKTLEGFFE